MVFKDELFEAQWLRTVGHAGAGGAEIGECLAAARHIHERDLERWHQAWFALADGVLADAEASMAAGRRVSARQAYLRASNYFRAAYIFLYAAPVDPRLVAAYRQHRDAFLAAGTLMTPAAETIAIDYDGTRLRGYFLRAAYDRVARPTLIVNGGYDSTAEEGYFFSGAAALARGYNIILFDGPGQGGALIEDGLRFRPDWENVIGPVVDYALTRPEIDPARIALLGISFGGYLAPRAASAEPRLAALIADPGEFSLYEEMLSRVPGVVARGLDKDAGWAGNLLKFVLERRLRHPTAGWGLRRALWVHGVDDPLSYLRLTADYSLKGRARNISCPSLICAAENDRIGVTARKLHDALTCDKAFLRFTAEEGAGEHCEAGARAVFNRRAFDWLDEVFAR